MNGRAEGEKRGGDSFKMNECGLRSRTKTPDQFTPLTHRCVVLQQQCGVLTFPSTGSFVLFVLQKGRGGGKKKQQPGISVAEEPIIFCSGACFRCQT